MYVTDETEDGVPLTDLMATRFGKKLSDVCKNDYLRHLRPHGKTQVTVQHVQGTHASLDPRKIHTVSRGRTTARPSCETLTRISVLTLAA